MAVVARRRRVFGFGGLGDYPPNALGQQALDIYHSLPAGSGVSPIGVDPAYPWPHNPPQENVVDTVYGGNRYTDWYNAHPVMDVSGLFLWTSPTSVILVGGLDRAHALAAQILQNNGDTSFSADIHPPNAVQAGQAAPTPGVSVTDDPYIYTPTTWHPTADYQPPPPDLAQHPNQPPPPPVAGNPVDYPHYAPPVSVTPGTPGATPGPLLPPQVIPVLPPTPAPAPAPQAPDVPGPTDTKPSTVPDASSIAPVSIPAASSGSSFQNANGGSSGTPLLPYVSTMPATTTAPSVFSSPLVLGGIALLGVVLLSGKSRR